MTGPPDPPVAPGSPSPRLPSLSDNPELEDALTGALFSHYRSGSLINLVVTLVCYYLLHTLLDNRLPELWLAGSLLTHGYREYVYRAARTATGAILIGPHSRQQFTLGSSLQALCLGSLGVIILLQPDMTYRLLFLCVLMGMSGGAVIHLSASRRAYAIYATALLLPSSLILLTGHQVPDLLAGGLGLVYMAAMLYASHNTHLTLHRSLALAFDKEALIKNLEAASAQLEEHHHLLEGEVAARTIDLQKTNDRLRIEIQERNHAEIAARKSEQQLRNLTDMLPEVVFEMNAAGDLTYLNQKGLELLGVAPATDPGYLKAFNVFAPAWAERAERDFGKALEGRSVIRHEYSLRSVTGDEIPVLVVLAPILDEGRCLGGRGIAVDLTRLKELENLLLQTQKMDAIGTLAGGVAHDFNNILMAILGHAEIAARNLANPAKAGDHLKVVSEAVFRGKTLVEQILTFSRRGQQQRQAVDLNGLARECLTLLRASIPATIRTDFRMGPSPCLIHGDPGQIHQLIVNLCTNAYQEMEGVQGTLRLEVSRVTLPDELSLPISELAPGPYVQLQVTDTGPGIDPSILPRIFEPFYTTKSPSRGTGMGLAVVHGIVKSHGGAISVASSPGAGATFKVFFPEVDSVPAEPNPAADQVPARGGNILFVDDEPSLTDIARETLPHYGFQVVVFNDPKRAAEAFQSAPDRFDLLVTDQTMPGMTGVELASRLRGIRPDLPVIIYSGNLNFVGTLPTSLGAATRTLSKPLNMNDLNRAIQSLLAAT